MKKKKNKSKLKIIIILAILIFIILFSILKIIQKRNSDARIELKKVDTTFEEREAKLEIKVNNLYELVKLSNREIEINEYTEGIESLIKGKFQDTYEKTKNMTNRQLEEEFSKNKQEIFDNYGIKELEIYKELVEKLQIYKDDIKVTNITIEKDSCYIEDENIISKLKIKYDNNKEIQLTLEFANSQYSRYPYLRIK
ncbi:MAG: hypothetical protein HFJ44_02565 [Clostridia bacterium]|nr:hypothetical protein [Clostridia bacterium]